LSLLKKWLTLSRNDSQVEQLRSTTAIYQGFLKIALALIVSLQDQRSSLHRTQDGVPVEAISRAYEGDWNGKNRLAMTAFSDFKKDLSHIRRQVWKPGKA